MPKKALRTGVCHRFCIAVVVLCLCISACAWAQEELSGLIEEVETETAETETAEFETAETGAETETELTSGAEADSGRSGRRWQDQEDTTWSIRVNVSTNTVTVYRGQVAVKAFACSCGEREGSTPLGNYQLKDKLRWHELVGPSWGQWCSHITGDILFHSLPYYTKCDNFSLDPHDYNQMGTSASHGCVRLTAANAKYIFDNCPIGTHVILFAGISEDDPLGKPMPLFVGDWNGVYDPTDITIAEEGRTSDERWEAWSKPWKEFFQRRFYGKDWNTRRRYLGNGADQDAGK